MNRLLGTVATVAVCALLLVLGVTWLGHLTNDDPGNPSRADADDVGDRGGDGAGAGGQPAAPQPPRRVSVGGVRLDGTSPDLSCAIITNPDSSVPIRVTGVTFRHDGDQMVAETTHCPTTIGDDPISAQDCRSGTVIPPGAGYLKGCRIGASPREPGGPWNGKPAQVVLSLAVTCTSTEVQPCDQIGGAYRPTTDEPVEVVWDQTVELSLNPGDYAETGT